MTDRKERIQSFFEDLTADTLHLIDAFYDPEVHFEDPVVELDGRQALHDYYGGLYKNVTAIRFEFSDLVAEEDRFAGVWMMYLNAKPIKGGATIVVPGVSHLRFNPATDQVIYHRDYFDMGAFIYEHVPVLGQAIRFVKSKLEHG